MNVRHIEPGAIEEYFRVMAVSPRELDTLLEKGFRHFGTTFFRYNLQKQGNETLHVIPLRINLSKFSPSKSQKRILRRNRDLEIVFRDACLDVEKERLFSIHKERFKDNVPRSLLQFLSPVPSAIPCKTRECCAYLNGKLVAVGFMDEGETSTSCVYTIFDTAYGRRSMGILMILLEIQYSVDSGMRYVYPGYAYIEDSFYDYKKNFTGLEYYDWKEKWSPLANVKPEDESRERVVIEH